MVGEQGYLNPNHVGPLDAEEQEQYEKIKAQLEEYKAFLEQIKRNKIMVTKLNAKQYPALTKLLALTGPVKNFRHKGHDFAIIRDERGFVFQIDGETITNDGQGWPTYQNAMAAVKQYVRDHKKTFHAHEGEDVDPAERKKFIQTLQDHLNRYYPHADVGVVDNGSSEGIEVHVGDMVLDPSGLEKFEDRLNDLFWEMKTKRTYKTIEPNWWGDRKEEGIYLIGFGQELDDSDRMMSNVKEFPWAGTGHEDYIQDLANLMLVDAVAYTLEDQGIPSEFIPAEKLVEWKNETIFPGAELTETIPEFFTQNDFGYHRYLPTGTIKEIEAKVNKALDGKVTLKEIYEKNDKWASDIVLQCMGHGVAPTDDPEFMPWIEQFGVTQDNLDQFPDTESEYESALNMLEDFYKYEQSGFNPDVSLSNSQESSVQVFDNGGETLDRYTVLVHNADGSIDVYGMSQNPYDSYGFNQYNFTADSIDQINLGNDVEVPLDQVPEAVRRAIQERLET